MAGKSNIQREYFSVQELSDYSGIGVRTLRDKLNASTNPIPSFRFGGSIKIKRSDFDDWAKSCRNDNGRVNQLVDEVIRDLGKAPKSRRKNLKYSNFRKRQDGAEKVKPKDRNARGQK